MLTMRGPRGGRQAKSQLGPSHRQCKGTAAVELRKEKRKECGAAENGRCQP